MRTVDGKADWKAFWGIEPTPEGIARAISVFGLAGVCIAIAIAHWVWGWEPPPYPKLLFTVLIGRAVVVWTFSYRAKRAAPKAWALGLGSGERDHAQAIYEFLAAGFVASRATCTYSEMNIPPTETSPTSMPSTKL